jgi:hypothetical protein
MAALLGLRLRAALSRTLRELAPQAPRLIIALILASGMAYGIVHELVALGRSEPELLGPGFLLGACALLLILSYASRPWITRREALAAVGSGAEARDILLLSALARLPRGIPALLAFCAASPIILVASGRPGTGRPLAALLCPLAAIPMALAAWALCAVAALLPPLIREGGNMERALARMASAPGHSPRSIASARPGPRPCAIAMKFHPASLSAPLKALIRGRLLRGEGALTVPLALLIALACPAYLALAPRLRELPGLSGVLYGLSAILSLMVSANAIDSLAHDNLAFYKSTPLGGRAYALLGAAPYALVSVLCWIPHAGPALARAPLRSLGALGLALIAPLLSSSLAIVTRAGPLLTQVLFAFLGFQLAAGLFSFPLISLCAAALALAILLSKCGRSYAALEALP